MLLYYITDRSQLPGNETTRRLRLLQNIAQAVRCGVDFIQLREKDLPPRQLETLARETVQLRTGSPELKTAFLINSRTDIALASGAQGVHLRSNDISPSEARTIWSRSSAGTHATVGVSCHTCAEVARAAQEGADFAVFGPVFGKVQKGQRHASPAGFDALREACQERIPVIALGGVTLENADACLQTGAAGIAAIRLFQENRIEDVVAALRKRSSAASLQASANLKSAD